MVGGYHHIDVGRDKARLRYRRTYGRKLRRERMLARRSACVGMALSLRVFGRYPYSFGIIWSGRVLRLMNSFRRISFYFAVFLRAVSFSKPTLQPFSPGSDPHQWLVDNEFLRTAY